MPHMLSIETFQSAAIALKPGGRFVVVSDNEAFSLLSGGRASKLLTPYGCLTERSRGWLWATRPVAT